MKTLNTHLGGMCMPAMTRSPSRACRCHCLPRSVVPGVGLGAAACAAGSCCLRHPARPITAHALVCTHLLTYCVHTYLDTCLPANMPPRVPASSRLHPFHPRGAGPRRVLDAHLGEVLQLLESVGLAKSEDTRVRRWACQCAQAPAIIPTCMLQVHAWQQHARQGPWALLVAAGAAAAAAAPQ